MVEHHQLQPPQPCQDEACPFQPWLAQGLEGVWMQTSVSALHSVGAQRGQEPPISTLEPEDAALMPTGARQDDFSRSPHFSCQDSP